MLIELKDFTVETKKEITFGDMEDVQSEMGNHADFTKGNAKLLEVAITSIKDKEGNEVKYSNEWRRNLSIKDGLKLTKEVQSLVGGLEDLVKKG